jgi:hypothetical protein
MALAERLVAGEPLMFQEGQLTTTVILIFAECG